MAGIGSPFPQVVQAVNAAADSLPRIGIDYVLEFLKVAVCWPIVFLLLLLAFRKQIASFVPQLLGRLTKGPFGLEFDVKEVRKDMNRVMDQIANLYALSMSSTTYGNLKKLARGESNKFFLDPNLKVGLAVELDYLQVLGYIAFDKIQSVRGVADLPKGHRADDKLSRYIRVTESGKDFIKLREGMEQRLTESHKTAIEKTAEIGRAAST